MPEACYAGRQQVFVMSARPLPEKNRSADDRLQRRCAETAWNQWSAVAILLLWLCGFSALVGQAQAEPAGEKSRGLEPLKQAHLLWLAGRYQEAEQQFRKLLPRHGDEAAVGLARVLLATGKRQQALKLLQKRAPASKNASLHALLGRIHLDRGDWDAAEKTLGQALRLEPDCLPALWYQSELHLLRGQLDQAAEIYRTVVQHYLDHQEQLSAEELLFVALAGAQHARWNKLHDQFSFLVNELLPDVLRLQPKDYRAWYQSGRLFLEKYNRAEALRCLQNALKLNPRAAEVLAALAELALQTYQLDRARLYLKRAEAINPELVQVHRLWCDWHVANFDLTAAQEAIRRAAKLNPRDPETLGRRVALWVLRHGMPPADGWNRSPLVKQLAEVESRCPRPGRFYYAAGVLLSRSNQLDAAAFFLRRAAEAVPQMPGPQAELGLLFMRLGEEAEAAPLLRRAFDQDPFHVRVNNMLQVLDLLAGYATLETEHFVIRFDRGQDELLARTVAQVLEQEVYPQLCKKLGYEPQGKTLYEIFSRHGGTSGHQWFSARTVGLPYVGTVGACTGGMVALVSPLEMDKPFNWGRVVRHEFVHVLNLQQTRFRVPHWLTEGLAVELEGYPPPPRWKPLLRRRWQEKTLFTLKNINLGFIRPGDGDDWHLAYCQSWLYVQYMKERFGSRGPMKLLQAYAAGPDTPEAIRRAFGLSLQEFEDGYRHYVERYVRQLPVASAQEETAPLAQLEARLAKDPQNADLAAQVAQGRLKLRDYAGARKLAQRAWDRQPGHPLAGYVLARVFLTIGETDQAQQYLEKALDRQKPHPRVVALLAALAVKSGQLARAEELYRLAHQAQPLEARWLKALAGIYLKRNEPEKLRRALEQLAALESDNAVIRKKLAQLALARGQVEQALRWANQAVQINVKDELGWRLVAQAASAAQQWSQAAFAWEAVTRLRPRDQQAQLELARCLVRLQRWPQARAVLQLLLQAPDPPPEARRLWQSLPAPGASSPE